jgi:hypothetical protein
VQTTSSIAFRKGKKYNIGMILRLNGKGIIITCLMVSLWLVSETVYPQVPDALRMPERGEAPRYPEDLMIGELGQGKASAAAYLFARNSLSALIRGNNDYAAFAESGAILIENLIEEIAEIKTRTYRIGGGRTEADGCVSFIVRFIGATESITGELFIRFGELKAAEESDEPPKEGWLFDDLILEEKRLLSEIRDDYRYDFSPYERFY